MVFGLLKLVYLLVQLVCCK